MDQERQGEQIDRALLKNVLDIFVEIGITTMECYDNDFEDFFLKDTTEYYSVKAQRWIVEDSPEDYIIKAEECMKREKERVGYYLHINSEPKLLEIMQNVLLGNYAAHFLDPELSGCSALLRDDKFEDLSRMYRFFSKIIREPFSNIFKTHVTNAGTALVKQAEDAADIKKVFGWKIIELRDKYVAYVTDCFQGHVLFHKALKEAFKVFCNMTVSGSSIAELLATFCDNILRNDYSEKLSDEAIEVALDKVVLLLDYISDKDLFSEFLWRKLSRRLLSGRSANEELERCFLTNVGHQIGPPLVAKMQGMLTDFTVARDNQTMFEEYVSTQQDMHLGVDFAVTVLKTNFWPTFINFNMNLPSEMVKCVEVFKDFYVTTRSNRRLTWIYSLGTCNINANFDAKTIELTVTTLQAALLLLFNGADKLSYSEIITQLNLSDDVVVRTLHSLSCAKYKILSKEPAGTSISPNDVFEFNSKFTGRGRIKIPLPPVDQKKNVAEEIKKDRRYAIDASIVRIMKSRKVMAHKQLVAECVKQLSSMFMPDLNLIKRRIEDLMTRDYIERDKDDSNTYRYIAEYR